MRRTFIDKLIKNHLLPVFPGFAGPQDASLIALPLYHLWRGFIFESSADPDYFYLGYNILPLYMPRNYLYVGFGGRLRRGKIGRWHWVDTDAEAIISDLIEVMRATQRDVLDRFRSPSDIAHAGPRLFGMDADNQVEIYAYSHIYVGAYKEALAMLEALCERLEQNRDPGTEKEQYYVVKENMRDLLRANPEEARAKLLEWEQKSIRLLKLEKYPN